MNVYDSKNLPQNEDAIPIQSILKYNIDKKDSSQQKIKLKTQFDNYDFDNYGLFVGFEGNVILQFNEKGQLIEQFNFEKMYEPCITSYIQFYYEQSGLLFYAMGFGKNFSLLIIDQQKYQNDNNKQKNIQDYSYEFSFPEIQGNNIRAIAFKVSKFDKNKIYLCLGGFHRRISFFLIEILNDNLDMQQDNKEHYLLNKVSLTYLGQAKHKFPIIKMKFSQNDFLLTICHNHETVQIYDFTYFENIIKGNQGNDDKWVKVKDTNDLGFLKNLEDNVIQDQLEFCNVRGHRGFINDAEFSLIDPNILVTSSDDQTVKFWDIYKINNKKVANKPKSNKNENRKKQQTKDNKRSHKEIQNKYENYEDLIQKKVKNLKNQVQEQQKLNKFNSSSKQQDQNRNQKQVNLFNKEQKQEQSQLDQTIESELEEGEIDE
ncbi:WD40-repeat-containing domain [Pseudocohnilembus persalinus]|uniref:WD40-repeat-containing domain n=1 Tax=Pseudocohnilembus persalinus TaxID=266149 RepID=A0A0V0R8Z2_PSEPJ|nr:WD40-repeat-containing domain [Pseudocohnilembus persalinus]|eukprot:KRX10778.1 WD40-repeat-containing domain [Pseudocohnilembus persalinus]